MKTGFKQLGLVALIVSLTLLTGCGAKEDPHAGHQAAHTASDVVEQTMCPIMDAPINKNLFVEYEGKKVYFCCPGCSEEFNKNPEKYLPSLPQFQK